MIDHLINFLKFSNSIHFGGVSLFCMSFKLFSFFEETMDETFRVFRYAFYLISCGVEFLSRKNQKVNNEVSIKDTQNYTTPL